MDIVILRDIIADHKLCPVQEAALQEVIDLAEQGKLVELPLEITLGDGKLGICNIWNYGGESGILIWKNNKYVPVGSEIKHPKNARTTNDLPGIVLIKSSNIKSIDIMIEKLNCAKVRLAELEEEE